MAIDKVEAATRVMQEVLESASAPCVTTSFQADGMALVHMLTRLKPSIPVLFLDTGYHFAETYAYRDQMAERLGLNLVNLLPRQTVQEQESQFGILNQTAPDRCCQMRKVEPLFNGLQAYDVWFSALRREQSPSRAGLQVCADFRLPSGKSLLKVSPMADWTKREVWAYLKQHGIPVLPLYDQGFTSIGCEPCTQVPFDPENPRSGRWGGAKLECGIHIEAR